MKVELKELETRIEKGLINKQKHPEFPLYIYNYSKTCQFGRDWDEYTMMCRGLILDEEGNIVSRPFKKFFNLEELEGLGMKLPNDRFTVTKKYDGSLGISYWWNGKMYLATRGSFISDQAVVGTQILQEKYGKVAIDSSKTYLFEIIYPENRIVINYEGMKDLVLLAVLDTETGEEVSSCFGDFKVRETIDINDLSLKSPKQLLTSSDINDLSLLRSLEKPNEEGFVIVYPNGFRAKVKFDEYVRLHRIMTGVNARRVWDVLRNGDSLDEYLKNVPEEFEKWIRKISGELWDQYISISTKAAEAHGNLIAYIEFQDWDRKQCANWIMKNHKGMSGIIFKMLDDKPYADIIWKMIKPEATDPFKVEV